MEFSCISYTVICWVLKHDVGFLNVDNYFKNHKESPRGLSWNGIPEALYVDHINMKVFTDLGKFRFSTLAIDWTRSRAAAHVMYDSIH